jgi:hypothetical protein
LLARASQYGYTAHPGRALNQEPEAISADAQRIVCAQSRASAQRQRVETWEEHRANLQRTMAWLYSQRLQRDVRTQLRALERQIERLDRKIAPPGGAASAL